MSSDSSTPVLPANRVASLAAFITGLAGCATALAGAWPSAATNEIAVIAGGVLTLAGPISHVIGSWLWDKRTTDVKLKEMELELEKLYHERSWGADYSALASPEPDKTEEPDIPNIPVADVPEDTEAPDEIDPEEAAVDEELDEAQQLKNREPGQPGPGVEEAEKAIKAPPQTTTTGVVTGTSTTEGGST